MVEVKIELKAHKVIYICDNCKKGKMLFQIISNEGYVHRCEYCKEEKPLNAQYPLLYEEK